MLVIAAVVAVGLIGLAAVHAIRRPPATRAADADLPKVAATDDRPAHAPLLGAGDVMVLAPSHDTAPATVLGRHEAIAALDRAGLLTPRTQRRPFQQLIDRVAGDKNDADRKRRRALADGPLEGGYLKLTEESRGQLRDGKPVVTRTGDMLGMVNNKKDKRRHMLRFTSMVPVRDPQTAIAVAVLQTVLEMQEQLEAIEQRLIEVQKALRTLCVELDRDRLAEIAGAAEILEDTARDIRRRGFMDAADWQQVGHTRLAIKTHLNAARFNLADLTRDFSSARSRRRRLETLEEVLKGNRLEYWLTMFVEAQLAHVRVDVLALLYEATAHPDHLGDHEQHVRAGIAARQRELASAGLLLRDLADPSARRLLDHFQQISRFRLGRSQPVVEGLLAQHGDIFAEDSVLAPRYDAAGLPQTT